MSVERVAIFDTTLRDGDQAPGCAIEPNEKLLLALQLEELGVDVIEAGFPVISEGEFFAVDAIAAECRRGTVAALSRALEKDIVKASLALHKAARSRIHVFIATSDLHLEHKLRKTRAEVLSMTRRAVNLAQGLANEVEFSAEDATRSDIGFLLEVLTVAIEEGANVINIPDTVGYTLPWEYAELIQEIKEKVVQNKAVTISAHCHNDLGLAVANSLAAITAGARQVECTINGIGERAGNASLEEVVMAMRVRADRFPYENGIETDKIYSICHSLSKILGLPLSPNKPIVGSNAFSHESGIHQDGFLKNPKCYEIMTPESVGAPPNKLVLGKHSGRHALAQRYEELGLFLAEDDLDAVYACFMKLAGIKKNICDRDLQLLLSESVKLPGRAGMANIRVGAHTIA